MRGGTSLHNCGGRVRLGVVGFGISLEGRGKLVDVLDVECELMKSQGELQGFLASSSRKIFRLPSVTLLVI